MQPWRWRKKPTSMVKIIEWLPTFLSFEGLNWDYQLPNRKSNKGNPIHPTRREYVYLTKKELLDNQYKTKEDFMSGQNDETEKESDARNDKATYEFYGFGYVDKNGFVKSTQVGKMIKEGNFNSDLLIKQLLKIQFPSPIGQKWSGEGIIFPMEIILKLFKTFGNLNRMEASFIFFCDDMSEYGKLEVAIKFFRERYANVENKKKVKEIEELFEVVRDKFFPNRKNKSETYYKYYSDSLFRCLEYTGYFKQSGRGYYTKLYENNYAKKKLDLLRDNYDFSYNDEEDFEKYMEYFGNPSSVFLPWEKEKILKRELIKDKMDILKIKINDAKVKIANFDESEYEWLYSTNLNEIDDNELLKLELKTVDEITKLNEKMFIKYYSKTENERKDILERFNYILDKQDDAALWLECNTWKSLVAMDGTHVVRRNFKIEEDLSPRSFAVGTGNTPDMEVYLGDYVLIPEVSLMSGVRQWEHEGSSVIDHVLSKIVEFDTKRVYGVFISEKMNIRTIWQFFILNRTSWIGKAVPVVPLTIAQYQEIIKYVYSNNLSIDDFNSLIKTIHSKTLEYEHFKEWENSIPSIIRLWSFDKIKLAN